MSKNSSEDCGVCDNINEWATKAQKDAFKSTATPEAFAASAAGIMKAATTKKTQKMPCPPDSKELGAHTWTYLHTMAAYYPEKPTSQQEKDMQILLEKFSKFYPCGYCADHMQQYLKQDPPRTKSRTDLSMWMCEMHNEVNDRLGKPIFDCSKVFERWKNRPKDGSCGK
ncbi:augmenter of liver regeneration [Rozella allomycis CSF55]|uniref:Sulfhydryl oxidase n=1 Tax=Rozella allomycis (strain CSF55) TaxID=988480 RepID=A0A075B0Y5_ROZAC|nr:Erv1/Alr domain-containing protein [Rozella allomycis CSF55]RKP18243.1 augmenter of liver regeneration [Rozella allomycis CSF55]|eukprot:EPZ34491.1 Erv1/Alr domain-containing protein [Rozella allomycis CSF55]